VFNIVLDYTPEFRTPAGDSVNGVKKLASVRHSSRDLQREWSILYFCSVRHYN